MRYLVTNNTDHALTMYADRTTASAAQSVRIGIGKSADADEESSGWLHCFFGGVSGWVKLGAGITVIDNGPVDPPPPPPPVDPTKTLVHTIQVYDDGSISIDGNPYP